MTNIKRETLLMMLMSEINSEVKRVIENLINEPKEVFFAIYKKEINNDLSMYLSNNQLVMIEKCEYCLDILDLNHAAGFKCGLKYLDCFEIVTDEEAMKLL